MLAAMLYVLAAVRPAPVVVQRARCAGPVMQQREDPPKDAVMKLVGSMLFGIETAVEAAKISTDNYINSGWQARCPPLGVVQRAISHTRPLGATVPRSRPVARHPRLPASGKPEVSCGFSRNPAAPTCLR